MMSERIQHIDWLEAAGDEKYEMNTANTSIREYIGAQAMFNHIYVDINDTDPGMGIYVWSDDPIYKRLRYRSDRLRVEREVEEDPSTVVLEVYALQKSKDLYKTSGVPEEWLR
jgi:hypothetical protein